MCIGYDLPWYMDYHYLLVLLTLAGCALVGVLLLRSFLKVKKRTTMHYLALAAGILFLLLLVFMVWVLALPVTYRC